MQQQLQEFLTIDIGLLVSETLCRGVEFLAFQILDSLFLKFGVNKKATR